MGRYSVQPRIFFRPIAAHCGPRDGLQVAFKTPIYWPLTVATVGRNGPHVWAACLVQWAE